VKRAKLLLPLLLLLPQLLFAAAGGGGEPTCAKNATTLHKGPGRHFPVTWKVSRYMPFMRYESKSGWARVEDLEGESHWAESKDLTRSIHCVVVKSQVANFHKEPKTSSKAADLKTLDRYTPLKKISVDAEWIHAEDEAGHQGWINEASVWKPVRVANFSF
jgi:SH3-like domain-containing protein